MAKIKLKESADGRYRIVYGKNEVGQQVSWQIYKNYAIAIPDEVAKELSSEIYEVSFNSEAVPTEVQPKEEAPKEPEDNLEKPDVLEKLEDIVEDLADDGLLNNSNNPNQKSPGRPKKKAAEKKTTEKRVSRPKRKQ